MNQKLESVLVRLIKTNAALILLLPLLVIKETYFPFTFPKIIFFRVLVEISAAGWILLAVYKKKYRPDFKNPILMTLTLFIMALMITTFTSADRAQSFWSTQERMIGVLTIIHFWLWFIILSSTLQEWQDWKKLLLINSLICFLTLIIGLKEFNKKIIFDTSQNFLRIFSTLGNPIYFSVYIILNIFLSFLIFLREKTKFPHKIFYAFFILFCLVVSFLTGSRGSLFAFLASLLIFLFTSLLMQPSKKMKIFSLASACFLSFIFFLAGLGIRSEKGREWSQKNLPLATQRIFYSDYGSNSRLTLWKLGLKGFKDRPIFGWGWENYNIIYHKHYDPIYQKNLTDPWYDRSHNQIIDILALTGIIGFLTYISFWLAIFYSLIKRLMVKPDMKKRLFIVSLISLFSFYFIQNLFVFDSPVPLILFYFSLGLTIFLIEEGEIQLNLKKMKLNDQIQKPNILDQIAKIPFSASAFSIILSTPWMIYYFNVLPFKKNIQGVDAYKTISTNFSKGIALFKQSLDNSSFTNELIRNELIKSVLLSFNNPKILKEDLKIGVDFAISESNKNIEEHPYEIRYYLAGTMLYGTAHQYDLTYLDKAKDLMKKALLVSPKRPEILKGLEEIERLKKFYHRKE